MKIRRFTLTEVVVAANPGTINSPSLKRPLHKLPIAGQPSWSKQFDELPKLILQVEMDNEIVGLGEFYRGHDWTTIINVCNMLLGQSVEKLCRQALPIAWCREYDGFECAIWDAYAKLRNMRVVDLLGGCARDKIKVGAWSGHRLKDEVGELARQFSRRGYDCLKFKCDLEDDVVGWCEEIAEAAPKMKVILDPNERWERSSEARQRIARLAEVGNVLCLEDPIPRWMIHEYRALKAFSPIPIALHVSLPYMLHGQRVEDALTALQHDAVDGFNFNCGLANFQRLDHIAGAAGLPCWHGSEIDLGILEAMYLHSCAAAQSCIWPSDIFGRLIRSHDLLKRPLTITPPYAMLPEKPGLGVELDEDALSKFQRQRRVIPA